MCAVDAAACTASGLLDMINVNVDFLPAAVVGSRVGLGHHWHGMGRWPSLAL